MVLKISWFDISSFCRVFHRILTYQIHPRSHPIPFPTFLSPPTRSCQPKGHRYDDRPYPR